MFHTEDMENVRFVAMCEVAVETGTLSHRKSHLESSKNRFKQSKKAAQDTTANCLSASQNLEGLNTRIRVTALPRFWHVPL